MLLNDAILAAEERLESCSTLIVTEHLKPHDSSHVQDQTLSFIGSPPKDLSDNSEFAFKQVGSRLLYGIFGITDGESGLELFLDSSWNRHLTGWPQRADYKPANLERKPIRITINWKSDFTMTGRKERTFHVHDYLFIPLGEFSEFEFERTEDISSLISSDILESAKHVDLCEILY